MKDKKTDVWRSLFYKEVRKERKSMKNIFRFPYFPNNQIFRDFMVGI